MDETSDDFLRHAVANSTQFSPGWRQVCQELLDARLALAEREIDVHRRIRRDYDKTVADSWRAANDKLRAENERLRAAIKVVVDTAMARNYESMPKAIVSLAEVAGVLPTDGASALASEPSSDPPKESP